MAGLGDGEHGIDERGGRTEIIHRVEEAIEFRESEKRGNFRLRSENFAQVALGRGSSAAGGFDFFVSCGTPELFRESHGDGLRVNQATSQFEIFAHSICVHMKIGCKRREVVKGSRGKANDFGQRFPFSLPGAEAALMLVGLRSEYCVHKARNAIRASENGGARNGILFVRHCGGAAATRSGWLGEFSNFGLHMQSEVAGDFVECADKEPEARGDFSDAISV